MFITKKKLKPFSFLMVLIFLSSLIGAQMVLIPVGLAEASEILENDDNGVEEEFISQNDELVNIPDSGLEQAVREALEIPEGDITVSDMARLDILDAEGREIENLAGLEHAVNLEELWLMDNYISDLTPLEELTGLVELGLLGNQISDLEPLEGLVNLEFLGFWGNDITDIGPLAVLTSLDTLILRDNNISDLTPLQGLTNLEQLGLWGNQITDIEPLAAVLFHQVGPAPGDQLEDSGDFCIRRFCHISNMPLGNHQGMSRGNRIMV